ncbi:unnamed protein product [Prunus brigantina]
MQEEYPKLSTRNRFRLKYVIYAGPTGSGLRRMEGLLMLSVTGQKSAVLIQLPNGPRSDAEHAVKRIKIQEMDE